jgi:hypothetical protein
LISDGIEQDLPPCNIELEAKTRLIIFSFKIILLSQKANLSDEQLDEQEEFHLAYYMETARIYQKKDAFITNSIQQATKRSNNKNKKATINFPYMLVNPVSEYDTNSDFFKKHFHISRWKRDFHQFRDTKLTVSDWAKNLLLYEMAVLLKIKCGLSMFWNFLTRKKTKPAEDIFQWIFSKKAQNLEELKAKLKRRYFSWIDRICYYSKLSLVLCRLLEIQES